MLYRGSIFHDQNEWKMLKWLKQKPTGHHLRGGGGGNIEGSHEVDQNKVITDDPLATIQVHHPQLKKSKNKSEEIYAVSRWVWLNGVQMSDDLISPTNFMQWLFSKEILPPFWHPYNSKIDSLEFFHVF